MTPAEQQVLAAWISAAAAVVQAIGAIGAIIAAVVLARSSARREQLADAAAERRRIEADEASEARIDAERIAAEQRQHKEERERYNRPIDLMLKLGEKAKIELQASLSDYEARIGRMDAAFYSLVAGPHQSLLHERTTALVEQAETAAIAAAIRAVGTAFAPPSSMPFGTHLDYLEVLSRKIAEGDRALEKLDLLRREVGER